MRAMNPRLRLSFLIVLLLALAISAPAQVAAPQFLPGQPMVVGDQVLMMWAPVPGAAQYAVFHNGREVARVASNQYRGVLPKAAGEHQFHISGPCSAPTPYLPSGPTCPCAAQPGGAGRGRQALGVRRRRPAHLGAAGERRGNPAPGWGVASAAATSPLFPRSAIDGVHGDPLV
jgi:hypothetical protein